MSVILKIAIYRVTVKNGSLIFSSRKFDLLSAKSSAVGKIAKKQSKGVRFCSVKNTLLQTAFSAILPNGKELFNSKI